MMRNQISSLSDSFQNQLHNLICIFKKLPQAAGSETIGREREYLQREYFRGHNSCLTALRGKKWLGEHMFYFGYFEFEMALSI